jgi:hypothetical protein
MRNESILKHIVEKTRPMQGYYYASSSDLESLGWEGMLPTVVMQQIGGFTIRMVQSGMFKIVDITKLVKHTPSGTDELPLPNMPRISLKDMYKQGIVDKHKPKQ